MPYADPAARTLPYQTDLADDSGEGTSQAGARAISARARTIRQRYVRALYAAGAAGLTDWEAAKLLREERTTIIPRRHELEPHVRYAERKRRCPESRQLNKVYALAVFLPPAATPVVHIPEVSHAVADPAPADR